MLAERLDSMISEVFSNPSDSPIPSRRRRWDALAALPHGLPWQLRGCHRLPAGPGADTPLTAQGGAAAGQPLPGEARAGSSGDPRAGIPSRGCRRRSRRPRAPCPPSRRAPRRGGRLMSAIPACCAPGQQPEQPRRPRPLPTLWDSSTACGARVRSRRPRLSPRVLLLLLLLLLLLRPVPRRCPAGHAVSGKVMSRRAPGSRLSGTGSRQHYHPRGWNDWQPRWAGPGPGARGSGLWERGGAARPGPTAGPGGAGRRRSHFLAAGPSAGGRAGPGGGTGPRLPEAGRGRVCQRSAGWERAGLPPGAPAPAACNVCGRWPVRGCGQRVPPWRPRGGRGAAVAGEGGWARVPYFSLFFSWITAREELRL